MYCKIIKSSYFEEHLQRDQLLKDPQVVLRVLRVDRQILRVDK